MYDGKSQLNLEQGTTFYEFVELCVPPEHVSVSVCAAAKNNKKKLSLKRQLSPVGGCHVETEVVETTSSRRQAGRQAGEGNFVVFRENCFRRKCGAVENANWMWWFVKNLCIPETKKTEQANELNVRG